MFSDNYLTVMGLITSALKAVGKPDLSFDKGDQTAIKAVFALGPGRTLTFHIRLFKEDMEIRLNESEFESGELEKFLSEFEFNLEQQFTCNIKTKAEHEGAGRYFRFYV